MLLVACRRLWVAAADKCSFFPNRELFNQLGFGVVVNEKNHK